ncbi:recombinase RecT, partial [Janthinobacterium sp.]|uniref:recombinase RecT n=1 Tax=Janthinobacterium sp. TaxID=1871054 RepID=UPI0025C09A12
MSNAMVLRPQNFDQLTIFAEMAASSSMVPAAMRGKPADIMLAVQMGSEIGLAPMQAIQNIAVINGRPSLWGDAMMGLCKQHPAWGGVQEAIEGEGDDMRAVCTVGRKGDHPAVGVFSVADAKKAGLWGKQGPWQQYPKRMLQMRARGFALRDAFPDALRGLISAEEAQDIPPDTFKGTTIDARVEPPEPVSTAPTPKRTVREIVRDYLVGCTSTDDVANVADMPLVAKALKEAPADIKDELNRMLGEAYA